MAKYHITKKGEPGVCNATRFACPLGGADEHFDSKEAAQVAYEAKMTAALIPAGTSKDDLKLKELNELAKLSSDREILHNAISKGSDRTLKNLARNPHMDTELLLQAYDKASKDDTMTALVLHPNFPVARMSPKQFAAVVSTETDPWGTKSPIQDDAVTDAHVNALVEADPTALRKRVVDRALANPNNRLTDETIAKYAEMNVYSLAAAMRSGRYPASRVVDLDPKMVYWGTISNLEDPKYLDAYADQAIATRDEDAYASQYNAHWVARNKNTDAATLQKLAEKNLACTEIVKHANATDETKSLAAIMDAEAGRVVKIQKLNEQYPDGLLKELQVKHDVATPFGPNRGIRDTTMQLDTKKITELGLSREDVLTLVGSKSYNGGVSYNEETGVFKGTVDSTD